MKADLRSILKCLAILAVLAILAGCGSANDNNSDEGEFDTPCRTWVCAEDGCEFDNSDDWTIITTPEAGVCINGIMYPECVQNADCMNSFECVWVLNEDACDDTACPGKLLCAPNCDDGNDCTTDFFRGNECAHLPGAPCSDGEAR